MIAEVAFESIGLDPLAEAGVCRIEAGALGKPIPYLWIATVYSV